MKITDSPDLAPAPEIVIERRSPRSALTVMLPVEDKAFLAEVAVAHGCSISVVLRSLVTTHRLRAAQPTAPIPAKQSAARRPGVR